MSARVVLENDFFLHRVRGFADDKPMDFTHLLAYFDIAFGALLLVLALVFYAQSCRAKKMAAEKAHQLEQKENELIEKQAQFQLALNGSNDGIWDWDMLRQTVYFSPRWKEMLGYKDSELESSVSMWQSLIHPEDKISSQMALRLYLAKKTPTYFCEYRLRHKSGHYLWILSRGIVQRDERGEPVRMAGSHTDITERIQKAEELEFARKQAEAATNAKSEFLANMSHEIRTPLNGILGMAKVLASTELSREQRECIDIISKSGESLLFVINDILDLSKMDAGKIEFEKMNVHLNNHIIDLVRTLRLAAEEKNVDVRIDISPDLPKIVVGDPGRLRQILTNLINNAIKFTHKGHVLVHVKMTSIDGQRFNVHFAVQDTGIGIPSEAQARLFLPFTQVDASTTRRYGGTGLGLFICKRLVELMGGQLGVESRVGEGSRFWFEIPMERAQHQMVTDEASASGVFSPLTRARILVAEDNPINQAVMKKLLSKMGHEVVTAEDGVEVLHLLEKGSFDLVLMDCQMPAIDGYEAARRIRLSPHLAVREIPIIAVTANALRGEFEKCLAAGMNDFLTKPLEYQKLAERIEIWLPSPGKLRKSA